MTRRIYQGLFFIIIIACTLLFFKEVSHAMNTIPHLDKLAHFSVFFILTGLFKKAIKAPVWVYLLVLSVYGAGVELVQGTLPHRQASLADFVADFLGIIGYLVFDIFWQKHTDTKQNEA